MNITKNLVVSIGYTLKDADNRIIDSAPVSDPLVYLHGYENIIPGLEKALEGKTVGDTFDIIIPASEAYGEWNESLVTELPLDRFDGEQVEEGMRFQTQTDTGCQVVVTVTGVSNGMVTIDGNHPLAGMELNFNVTVAGIREADPEELAHGHIHAPCGDCGGEGGCGCAYCGNCDQSGDQSV
ncbi:MAG: peptidylprolyl isomerase [Treponema sp.]|jgi:FKBP-type peptidyl-prolyl cis-trans isomerase SlyD|nr:peptidylprolyl isomerase [Treponema sp.]